MIARKREEQKSIEDKTASVREKLKERKDRLKKGGMGVGLTKEEQQQLLNRYKNQLEQLDSAYIAEQKRQALMMKQRQEMKHQRQQKLLAMQEKYQQEKKQEARGNLRAGLKNILGNKGGIFDSEGIILDTSELLRRLREWQDMKSQYDKQAYLSKLDVTEVEIESDVVKILILKLLQLEKSLKDMGRIQKKRAKKAKRGVERTSTRGSVYSAKRSNSKRGSRFAKVHDASSALPQKAVNMPTTLDGIEEGDEN